MSSNSGNNTVSNTPALFRPIKVGPLHLQHRIVLAPLTRYKATEKEHVPTRIMSEYYSQRASSPGTLLITEATFIAAKAGGYNYVPGIWSKEQIDGWKMVTDAVHSRGSFIFLQLWALGRAASPKELQAEDPSFPFVSSSDIPMPKVPASPRPRPLSKEEITEYIDLYGIAAKNAVECAGFDGVEIHGANGYLIDQFTQDVCNNRTDIYGGSIENRCRFAVEVVEKVVKVVGAERVAIRLSPWSPFQGMGMKDPKPTFAYLVQQIKKSHPSFAYIHVVEPRIQGDEDRTDDVRPQSQDRTSVQSGQTVSNDFLREIWFPKIFISAGGYKPETALFTAEKHPEVELIAFGRYFISTPDLPMRIRKNLPLTPYDRKTFYVRGDVSGQGYTDFPSAENDPRNLGKL